jgi:hypothetical protein
VRPREQVRLEGRRGWLGVAIIGDGRLQQRQQCQQQYSLLKILDEANVYYEIVQFGEWGNYFAGLQPAKGNTSFAKGNVNWWHNVFPNTTCNATLCQSAPKNPSNKCCAACLASKSCGALTNTTLFDVKYAAYATPVKDSEGRSLFGYKTMPQSRKEAYEAYRDYYNSRIAWISSVGDQPYAPMARINSVTCVSNMEAYAALYVHGHITMFGTLYAAL